MKRILLLSLIAAFSAASMYAEAPKREVRAVWLTTAWALDWPSVRVPAPVFAPDGVTITNEAARATARTQQQNQLRTIVDRLEAANFNTIYFQVRPMADAFFRSSFEPWSKWLSSGWNEHTEQHNANLRGSDPGWSPLGWLIEEAHARGMEVHAWLNPYRYTTAPGWFGHHPKDYDQSNPEWLIDYGVRVNSAGHTTHPRILNPGRPEVRQRIVDIVEEILLNYNVDGIVLDDYFYVSGTTNAMDQREFDRYPVYIDGRRVTDRAEWRREQINMMVADVQAVILETAPWVQWGISPAGVAMGANIPQRYRDAHGLQRPSPGSDWQFSSLHSDPVMWLRRGTIDYISPQIYWAISNDPATDYERITNWWAEVSNQFGRHLFVSNTATIGTPPNEYPWQQIPAQMVAQVRVNRSEDLNDAPGFVLFRHGTGQARGVYTALENQVFQHPVLPASFGWKEAPMQGLVENLTLSGQNLTWTYTNADTRVFPSPFSGVRYAVYAVPIANMDASDIFASSRYLIGISYTTNFTLPAGISPASHKIAVAVFDRFGNLFPPRTLGGTLTGIAPAQLTFPADGAADVVIPSLFSWEANGAHKYVWQLAEDREFTRPIASREVTSPYFNIGRQSNIREGVTYYWRVISMRADAPPSVSDVYSFTGTAFRVLTPAINETDVSLTPEISWINLGTGASYTLEISTTANFGRDIVYTAATQETSVTVSSPLEIGTNYFVRVHGSLGTIQTSSAHIRFRTDLKVGQVPVPTIISPTDGDVINGSDITVAWEEQLSRGFRLQLSRQSNFPASGRIQRVIDNVDVFTTTFTGLAAGTWYIRMQAQGFNTAGSAVWLAFTPAVRVELGGETSIGEININRVPVAFYTIMGIRLGQEPQSGIFIIRYDDGSVERVMR